MLNSQKANNGKESAKRRAFLTVYPELETMVTMLCNLTFSQFAEADAEKISEVFINSLMLGISQQMVYMKNKNFKLRRFSILLVLVLGCLLSHVQTVNAQKITSKFGFANVNGAKLYYEIAGRGKTVVLIHGGLVDSRMWDLQFYQFAKKYRVVRYDLQGFGKSDVPTKEFSHIEDLLGLLNFLKTKKASLIGLSLGGMIATDFTIEYPEMVEKLILVSSALRGDTTPPDEKTIAAYRAAKMEGREKAVELWLKHPLFASGKNDSDYQRKMRQMLEDNFNNWKPNPNLPKPMWAKTFTTENLGKINTPTLIILGEQDALVILKIGNILKEKIQQSKKIVIPKVSHHLNMEVPEKFNQFVQSFLMK